MLKTYLNPFGFVYFATKCWSFVSFWVTLTLLELEIINTSFPREIQKEIFTCYPFSFLPSSQTQNLHSALFPRTRLHSVFKSKWLLKCPTCPQFTGIRTKPHLHQKHAWEWNILITIYFKYESILNMGAGPCPLCHFSGPTSGNSLGPTFKEKLVDHNLSSQNDTRG